MYASVNRVSIGSDNGLSSAPSHYLNQCWVIINRIRRNKLQWILNKITKFFIRENAYENIDGHFVQGWVKLPGRHCKLRWRTTFWVKAKHQYMVDSPRPKCSAEFTSHPVLIRSLISPITGLVLLRSIYSVSTPMKMIHGKWELYVYARVALSVYS